MWVKFLNSKVYEEYILTFERLVEVTVGTSKLDDKYTSRYKKAVNLRGK